LVLFSLKDRGKVRAFFDFRAPLADIKGLMGYDGGYKVGEIVKEIPGE
jgi:hypothetical protein